MLVFRPACLPCAASRKEENGVLGLTFGPRLAVDGGRSEPAPVNRLVVPLFESPKRRCCRVSAADKGCRVYPLDPRPDAVALYSGCTLVVRRNASIIDIKMAQHRPRKPAAVEYSTDEEVMIVYDVEENEIESNPDYARKDGKTFFRGSLLLTPTRSRR
ncbi:hypothetical protein TNCV_4888861 [Trichonephila clavipes]|nr:hypothetical protein TNCV_4888861 [Trichonephila clavipes]